MGPRSVLVISAAAAALLLFPLGSFGRPAAENTWSGTWNTNFGALTLTQTGASVSGTYTHDQGRISGMISGSTLSGTWSEAPSYAGPGDAGPFKWTLAAGGKSWSGTWQYAGGGGGGDWSGSCTAGACLENGVVTAPAGCRRPSIAGASALAPPRKVRFSVHATVEPSKGESPTLVESVTGGQGSLLICGKLKPNRQKTLASSVSGTLLHIDEHRLSGLTRVERIALKVVGGAYAVQGGNNGFQTVSLAIEVVASNDRTCGKGKRGIVHLTENPGGKALDSITMNLCGNDHDHSSSTSKQALDPSA